MQDEGKDQARASDQDPPVLEYAALRGERRNTGLVTVATYGGAWEANLALGKLQAEGIAATLADQNIVAAGGGLYTGLAGGIKLQVSAGDAERARAALPRVTPTTVVKCPKCGSRDTRMVPQVILVRLLVILLLGLPSVLFGRRWLCAACHHVWRRSIYEESDDEDESDSIRRRQDANGGGDGDKQGRGSDAGKARP